MPYELGSIVIQMAPTKHAATKKSSSKCARTDSDNFRSSEANMKYNDCYKDKTIIMERVVQLESLEGTFIAKVFKERTWKKLLNLVGVVELEGTFSNATVDGDRVECWVRHKEFVITREIIQDFLEVRPFSQSITMQYEDRLGSTDEMIRILGGTPKKSSMNTIPFSPKMKALAYVMIHNLYPVTNLTTLSTPRTRFLYDLFTHKKIDIYGHIFHVLGTGIKFGV